MLISDITSQPNLYSLSLSLSPSYSESESNQIKPINPYIQSNPPQRKEERKKKKEKRKQRTPPPISNTHSLHSLPVSGINTPYPTPPHLPHPTYPIRIIYLTILDLPYLTLPYRDLTCRTDDFFFLPGRLFFFLFSFFLLCAAFVLWGLWGGRRGRGVEKGWGEGRRGEGRVDDDILSMVLNLLDLTLLYFTLLYFTSPLPHFTSLYLTLPQQVRPPTIRIHHTTTRPCISE